MLKRIGIIVFIVLGLVACSPKKLPHVVTVGTISGPETQLMEVAQRVAKERYHLDVQIVPFSDYNAPNAALSEHSIDANAFQHKPFLDAQVKARGYKLAAIGKTFIYPMGVYSRRIKTIKALSDGAQVAVPNDPTNEARALLLLQSAHLITLRSGAGINATTADIVKNPKKLRFIELDAAETPRALDDVALAVINTTFAIPAHLSPTKDALLHEDGHSPYANLIVVRYADRNKKALKELVAAFQSEPVVRAAHHLFGDAALPAWK